MSTQAIIQIYNKEEHVLTIYKHYDGYLDGLGRDIKDILGGRKVVNGIGSDQNVVNGMHNAAAILVAGLKKDMEAGDVYLHAPNAKEKGDYTYTLNAVDGEITLVAEDFDGAVLYDGPLSGFDPDMENDETLEYDV